MDPVREQLPRSCSSTAGYLGYNIARIDTILKLKLFIEGKKINIYIYKVVQNQQCLNYMNSK